MSAAIASFRRIRHKGLADRFYSRFLASDLQIAQLFERTDFARQKELLLHGIQMLLEYAGGKLLGTMAIERMAEMHERLGVTARMYDLWVDCLVTAVAELDPGYDHALDQAWRSDMEKGIAFMLECQARAR